MKNDANNRRKRFFANKLHRSTFFMIFMTSLIPMLIVTILLYYLIFQITAEEFGIPEVIAYNLIPAARKVTLILLIASPISVLLLMFMAHKLTHQMFGPFDRILRELDQRIETNSHDPVGVRKNDKFMPLVERINKVLARIK